VHARFAFLAGVSLISVGLPRPTQEPSVRSGPVVSRPLAAAVPARAPSPASGSTAVCPEGPSGAEPDVLEASGLTPPPNFSVSVTPDGNPVTVYANTSGNQVTFNVDNTGACPDSYGFNYTATGSITGVTLDKSFANAPVGYHGTVTATFSVGAVGTGVLKLNAGGSATDDGRFHVTVSPPPRPPGSPIVDITPYNFDKQDYSRCANACFAAMTQRATVPYVSLDAPRQVTLVYNGDRVSPHPFVLVNVSPDITYGSWPTKYQLQVKVNGAFITFANGEQTLNFSYDHATMGNAARRIGGQFDASPYTTKVYPMDILVTAVHPSTSITNDVVTKVAVVKGDSSPVARGWSVGGVQRLYQQTDSSALVVEGDGSAVYFSKAFGSFNSPAGEFSKLVLSNLSGSSGWARLYPDSTKVVFNNAGLMTQIRDPFNNMMTVVYDASNRVVKIKDPLNLGDTLTYGSAGLTTIKDPGGRITTITVDTARRLTAIRDPDNVSTQYGYDAQKRLSTKTDRRQAVITSGYDLQAGTLANVTEPSVMLYDGSSVSPTTQLAAWHKAGVPYGPTSPTAFTPVLLDSVRATVTEPGGAVTRFTVNRWGTPTRITDPLGRITTVTFDANGLSVKAVSFTGRVDTVAYNASGLPVFQRSGSDSAVNIHYAAWGQVDSTWGRGRPRVRNFIGPNGRIDSTRVGTSPVARFVYDSAGRLRSGRDPAGNLTASRLYASTFGNVSRDSLANGQVRTYFYDQYGRDTAIQVTSLPVRRTHYDLVNRPVEIYDGVHGTPTALAYDGGVDTMVTDVQGQVYRFTYNATGWLTRRTDPAGQADLYGYSRDGELMRWTNRRGQTISYAYDSLHRDTSATGVNKSADRWSYSSNELVVTATSLASVETVYLSVMGRPDSISTALASQTFWRRYHYTVSGLLDSMTVSGGGIPFRARVFAYDTTASVLKSIRLGPTSTLATTISRNANLQEASRTLPGGDGVGRQYDPLSQLASISSGAAYGNSVSREAQYDVLGRIKLQTLDGGGTAHKYVNDSLGRLTRDSIVRPPTGYSCPGYPPPIIGPDGSNCVAGLRWTGVSGLAFSYDAVGNRLDNGGSYQTASRVTAFAGCSYGTNFDGEVTSRTCSTGTLNLRWTADARLDTVIVGGMSVHYWYDAAGRLVRKDVNGTAQRYFLWNGNNLLAELNATATGAVAEYSYYPGLDRSHAVIVGGQAYYVHTDIVGNVIALTDSTQNLARSYIYDAWGLLTGGTDVRPFNGADRARWKGALWLGPDVDLYYLRSRWYEPRSGRFLSEDPVGLAGGINPYVFGNGDPINHADPQGLMKVENKMQTFTDGPVCWACSGSTGLEGIDAFAEGVDAQNAFDALNNQKSTVTAQEYIAAFTTISAQMDAMGIDHLSWDLTGENSLEWPHWGGNVGAWDEAHPTDPLRLLGGGKHGTPGFWSMKYDGPTTKWPGEWKWGSSEWSTNIGVTVAAYYGQFWDAYSNKVMSAFGIVYPSGFGMFTANPGTACDCRIRTYVP
jgi:RHS repeat-associated protein